MVLWPIRVCVLFELFYNDFYRTHYFFFKFIQVHQAREAGVIGPPILNENSNGLGGSSTSAVLNVHSHTEDI